MFEQITSRGRIKRNIDAEASQNSRNDDASDSRTVNSKEDLVKFSTKNSQNFSKEYENVQLKNDDDASKKFFSSFFFNYEEEIDYEELIRKKR